MGKKTSKPADSSSRGTSSQARAPTAGWLRWFGALVILGIGLVASRPLVIGALLSSSRQAWLRGDFHQAQVWTDRTQQIVGTSPDVLLMQASIDRSRGDWSHWQQLVEAAESAGARESSLLRERKLYQLAAGRLEDLQAVESMLGTADVSLPEILDAVLPGILASERFELAEQLLSQWTEQFPRDPNQLYWSAMLAEQLSLLGRDDNGSKQKHVEFLNQALDVSPYHQRARFALAKLDEEEDRLEEAYQRYAQLWLRDQVEEAQVATARLLRRLGRYQQARQVLGDLEIESAQRELALLEFEEGNLTQAIDLLQATASPNEEEALATALHLAERDALAQELFAKVANRREQEHSKEERDGRSLSSPSMP